jgi:hypothetical protein
MLALAVFTIVVSIAFLLLVTLSALGRLLDG